MRGFIREVLTIAGVAGGLAAAYFGAPVLLPHMAGWLGVEEGIQPERLFGILPYDILAQILSYGLIFIVVVIALSVVSHMLAETARSLGLGAVDRSLGFVFGLIRGVLLLGLLYLPFHLFIDADAKAAWFDGSRTHFYIEKTAGAMQSFLPEGGEESAKQLAEDAEAAVSAREKLKDIKLLPQGTGAPNAKAAAGIKAENVEGYTDEFRDELDGLFEEKTRSLNE